MQKAHTFTLQFTCNLVIFEYRNPTHIVFTTVSYPK